MRIWGCDLHCLFLEGKASLSKGGLRNANGLKNGLGMVILVITRRSFQYGLPADILVYSLPLGTR
jgi:hypothetical protein